MAALRLNPDNENDAGLLDQVGREFNRQAEYADADAGDPIDPEAAFEASPLAGSKVLAAAEFRTQGTGALCLHLGVQSYSLEGRGMYGVGVILGGDDTPDLWCAGRRLTLISEHEAWSAVAAGTGLPVAEVKDEVARVMRVVTEHRDDLLP